MQQWLSSFCWLMKTRWEDILVFLFISICTMKPALLCVCIICLSICFPLLLKKKKDLGRAQPKQMLNQQSTRCRATKYWLNSLRAFKRKWWLFKMTLIDRLISFNNLNLFCCLVIEKCNTMKWCVIGAGCLLAVKRGSKDAGEHCLMLQPGQVCL